MHAGATDRTAPAAALERGAAAASPLSRALSSASVSPRLGYFKDACFMFVSFGVAVVSAAHSVHQLGVQAPPSAEPLLLARRVVGTEGAREGVVQEGMAEQLPAMLQVQAQRQDVGVPVGIAVPARHDALVRVVARQLQEAAVFEFGGIELFERPRLFQRHEVRDGLQVEAKNVPIQGAAAGRIALCPTEPPTEPG